MYDRHLLDILVDLMMAEGMQAAEAGEQVREELVSIVETLQRAFDNPKSLTELGASNGLVELSNAMGALQMPSTTDLGIWKLQEGIYAKSPAVGGGWLSDTMIISDIKGGREITLFEMSIDNAEDALWNGMFNMKNKEKVMANPNPAPYLIGVNNAIDLLTDTNPGLTDAKTAYDTLESAVKLEIIKRAKVTQP